MSLLHVPQQKIESSLWRLLFSGTAPQVKRETGIRLKQFVMVRYPLPDPNFQASLQSTVAAALENSNGFQPLRQFYSHRLQVTYKKSPTVGELVCTKAFHFTPGSLMQSLHMGCECKSSPLCAPDPIRHIVLRGLDPLVAHLLGPQASAIVSQSMKTSTLPTPSEVEDSVYASTKRALRSVLSADPSSCDETAACIASKAVMHCSSLSCSSDPRVEAQNVRRLKKHHSDFIFPKIYQNPGSTWVICGQLWASLFMRHVLFAPHLKIVSTCDTIPRAENELFSSIEERSTSCDLHKKWKPFFPRCPTYKFLVPPISLLMKDKSKEHLGLLSSRMLVSHLRHPTSHYGKLPSRCLSITCASVSGDPSCLEIWEMNNCRQLFQEACSAANADSVAWQGLELDFVDMYHQIPTPSVIPAISYTLNYLQSRRAARRPYTYFAILKLQHSDDRFGTGASAWFKNVSIALVLDFISYEIFQNSFARAGSWIVQQAGGLPIGGPLSAQLTCLYLT